MLHELTGPEDLRGMSLDDLTALADEIRSHLVHSVAVTGGHLGSNLGVVELTLALHRVFDTPTDCLLWDTGHQAYPHKMVTGRAGHFDGLRQAGGLSGYPCRAESEHDHVENSHASTILAYAFGLALGDAKRGRGRRVVAVIGDGAMTGGLAYEALNNIGHRQARVVIVLNDNGRSYAPTVSNLFDGEPPKGFFEALGIPYIGPVDGHAIDELEAALRATDGYEGPVVAHVITTKGKGYAPAEHEPEKRLHDTAPFDPVSGVPMSNGSSSYTSVFADALVDVGERRPDVVAITAAMPGSTGLLPFAERFPDRFIDVGIAEQCAVTTAAGLAMAGVRPVVAIYSAFLNRAWDQVYYDVAMHGLPVVFCVDRAGITGDDGASHHGVLDMALLSKVPGMTVLAPSSGDELVALLDTALAIEDGPVTIRWPKGSAPEPPDGEVGSGLAARKLRSGEGLCLLAVGKCVGAAYEAGAALGATVWDVRVAHPLDDRMLADAAQHGLVATIEDGIGAGGVGSAVGAQLPGVRVMNLGTPCRYIPHGKPNTILTELGLDADGIVAAVSSQLSSSPLPS